MLASVMFGTAWLAQMRAQLRPNGYLRLIENRWVSSETSFVEEEWWAQCEDTDLRPVIADASMPVWVGIDASVKRDATAIVRLHLGRGGEEGPPGVASGLPADGA